MDGNRTFTKMPEILVFARALALGFGLAEAFRVAHIGGVGLVALVDRFDPTLRLLVVLIAFTLLVAYALSRGAAGNSIRLFRSRRVDLLLSVLLGIWANDILLPFTQIFHEQVEKANPLGVLLTAIFFLLMIASSLIRALFARRKGVTHQLYFLTDDEIQNTADDVLSNQEQATHFAQIVLESGANSGLVYGIDAPWGTGKTSFINLADDYWRRHAGEEVIVFKFEPLRYASAPDLAERFIRDLSAEIQRQVFVPEFRPAATRYTRMLKGKADISFLGFKLEVEPSIETIDELLEDIDDVLKRIRRRLIVVVDDLDRLEAKAVNSVLFTMRRTFRLTQAVYILCYDTENLVGAVDEGGRARQFLEKFVNIKLSLFVDSSALSRFLREDWNKDEDKYPSIPSDTMLKLASILSELATVLEDQELASQYMPLIGDMRKLKRFVNSLRLLQIEKTNLARTDFHSRDLVNLMLLHMNYPGIFRQIYVEETDGRSGFFSIKTKIDSGNHEYVNADGYIEFIKLCKGPDRLLLDQLFCVKSLKLDAYGSVEESVRAARACFNFSSQRNLETYLKLIVRFSAPEPRDTFRLYQEAVAKVIGGATIGTVFSDPEFRLTRGEVEHDQFWRILVSQSYEFKDVVADDSIETLVKYLPKYSSVDADGRGLRHRSIYTLIRLLDRAGWGRTSGKRLPNTPENVIEIASRIYGEDKYSGRGLIDRLAEDTRGVLGLYDLLLFRLQCSADRQGQVYDLQTALIVHDDMSAPRTGLVSALAVAGMRTLSQRIFQLFKTRYIDTKRNLFDDVDEVAATTFLGDSANFFFSEAQKSESEARLLDLIEGSRSLCKTFVVYQLANRQPGFGAGVGCGYYDSAGTADSGEIATLINDYVFDVCFDPAVKAKNTEHFLDYCLCNLVNGFWSGGEEDGYQPTTRSLANELNADKLAEYWEKYRADIRARNFNLLDKRVITLGYVATYAVDLPRVFDVLDQICSEKQAERQQRSDSAAVEFVAELPAESSQP